MKPYLALESRALTLTLKAMDNILLISNDTKVAFEKSQVPQDLQKIFKYMSVSSLTMLQMSIAKLRLKRFLQQRCTLLKCQPVLALPASERKISQQRMLCGTSFLRNSSVLCSRFVPLDRQQQLYFILIQRYLSSRSLWMC